MAAVILSLIFTLVVAGGLWLGLGARLNLHPDPEHNQLTNLAVYFLSILPLMFLFVFFVLGRLLA